MYINERNQINLLHNRRVLNYEKTQLIFVNIDKSKLTEREQKKSIYGEENVIIDSHQNHVLDQFDFLKLSYLFVLLTIDHQ